MWLYVNVILIRRRQKADGVYVMKLWNNSSIGTSEDREDTFTVV